MSLNNQGKPNPFSSKPKKKKTRQTANFVEALKSIGSSTASSFKNDIIKSSGQDMWNTTFGAGANPNINNSESHYSPDQMQNQEWVQQKENELEKDANKKQRHKELTTTPIYDRRQEEVKAQIKAIRQELQALAKEIANLGSGIQKAIEEEIAEPGTYHVNFFEKLRQFLVHMRKQVAESKNWHAISSQRKAAKQVYWGNVKKSGTKYMLSSERNMVTQTG